MDLISLVLALIYTTRDYNQHKVSCLEKLHTKMGDGTTLITSYPEDVMSASRP